jgi:hypothetical protein
MAFNCLRTSMLSDIRCPTADSRSTDSHSITAPVPPVAASASSSIDNLSRPLPLEASEAGYDSDATQPYDDGESSMETPSAAAATLKTALRPTCPPSPAPGPKEALQLSAISADSFVAVADFLQPTEVRAPHPP